MLKYPILFLAFLSLACQSDRKNVVWKQGDPLFPIFRAGRWGFISQNGYEVIPPKFRNVGEFTDSLAPARLQGTWGYINPKGQFVIPPSYDYAQSFADGVACVAVAGRYWFVNSKGQKAFTLPDSVTNLSNFENGKAHFTLLKNAEPHSMILKRDGTILADENIEYTEGLAVLTREVPDKKDDGRHTEYAVQDTHGQIIVPFGRYSQIEPFKNGFAEISTVEADFDDEQNGYINRNGKLVFLLPKGSYAHKNYFSEGLLPITTPVDPESGVYSSDSHYITWYDTTGKPVLIKPNDHYATPFNLGRTFTGDIRDWYLMDKRGNAIGENRFKWIIEDDLFDNQAIVAIDAKSNILRDIDLYGIIDSMGNYTVTPQFNKVHDALFQEEGMLVAINEPLRPEHGSPTYKPIKAYWGLIDKNGQWIFQPKLTQVSAGGYKNGLLYAEIDSLYGYIDPKGKFVWSAIRTEKSAQMDSLHLDFMLRSFYYGVELGAPTRGIDDSSIALPHARDLGFCQDELFIYVNERETTVFQNSYEGMAAYVVNNTTDTLKIDVQDNRLYIVAQAINPKGEWQNIEYSPSSWCGNSYYDVRLAPDEYWKFEIPVYNGDFATSFRLAFTWQKNRLENGTMELKTIYSNTYPGKINLSQFWLEQSYSPSGLMDPYFN